MREEHDRSYVEVSGTNNEMGYQHGLKCSNQIRALIKSLLEEARNRTQLSTSRIFELAAKFRPYIERAAPHLLEELDGIAEGAEARREEILFLNIRHELTFETMGKGPNECSAFAIHPSATVDGQTIIGQNVDLPPSFQSSLLVFKFLPRTGPNIMTTSLAGTLGHVGFNSKGIVRVGNALISSDRRPFGLSRYVLNRLVLEQSELEDAAEVVRHAERASAGNFLLADASGEALDVEVTAHQERVLKPQSYFLAHTNHYLHKDLIPFDRRPPRLIDSKIRYDRLLELITSEKNKISVGNCQNWLRDHVNYPMSICRHPIDNPYKTIASVIIQPGLGEMLSLIGNPCEHDYATYAIG